MKENWKKELGYWKKKRQKETEIDDTDSVRESAICQVEMRELKKESMGW